MSKLPWRRLSLVLAGLAALGACAYALYAFYPTHRRFFPKCLLYEFTGLYCPGCGASRAIFSLLHGNWRDAWAYNALIFILSPYILAGLYFHLRKFIWETSFPRWFTANALIWFLLITVLGYGVGRNLPWWPFCSWAPPR